MPSFRHIALASGEKEGEYRNYHCDEETAHHKPEALLSFSPTVFGLSQRGMPVSMQYLRACNTC